MTEPAYSFPVVINGRWTVRMPAHRAIRYLDEGDWEKERLASMALNLDPGDLVYDVGAEQGDMSALFQMWTGRICLVEPNPLAWPTIRAIWEENALEPPEGWFVGFASAVTSPLPGGAITVGSMRWPDCADGPMVPAAGFRHLAQETDTTPQLRLDELIESVGAPAAITIDIEGAELRALVGARRALEDHRPLVWISVHPEFMRHHFGERPAQLHRYMEELDYRAVHLGDDHESHWFYEPR